MMIKGVGVDIISVERFDRVLQKHGDRLLNTYFAKEEREMPLLSLAARFAAKEAVKKALNTPKISFKDIFIPSPAKEAVLRNIDIDGRILVSISHEKTMAVAVAIWESD
ncbi:holo-ACP synthase [Coprothermobacter platensis]|uniref:holo-ACP synthase n=1 Tax=Coprothermobacter platensis TaxID=108819 RepID=UPI00039F71D9|nr:holo-ACP synthase [Coprothermobacter platensis]